MITNDWFDEISAIALTESIPVSDEFGGLTFQIEADGIEVTIHVNKYERFISLRLRRVGSLASLIELEIPRCSGVRIVQQERNSAFVFFPPFEPDEISRSCTCIIGAVTLTIRPSPSVTFNRQINTGT